MLSRIFLILPLLFFTSCALFKGHNLQDQKVEDLLGYLKGTGEGKGRLGINQHQYLFGYDALLKENFDWILAANIPLHGEEILLLSNLKQEAVKESFDQSLEIRIEQGISEYLRSQKKSPKLAKVFLAELRKIMRLVLHQELGEKVACSEGECSLDKSVYQVQTTSKGGLSIKKSLPEGYEFEYLAQNLTDSIFKRSSIFLHSQNQSKTSEPLLSLELFWSK